MNSFRNLYNCDSKIHLVVQGKGNQKLLSYFFQGAPSSVLVNGVVNDSCGKTCYLEGDKNNITLIFNEKINSCKYMFDSRNNITEIDLSNFNASEVTSMSHMFSYCYNLNKIKFGNINTSSVEYMEFMFSGCSKLVSIDLSKFDTSNVTSMYYMFYGCSSLRYLDLSNFKTSQVSLISSMFRNCSSLIYLNIISFSFNHLTNYDNVLDGIKTKLIFCANEPITNLITRKYNFTSNCTDICFENDRKIDIIENKCTKICDNTRYEYENICYNECPKGTTYISSLENNNNYHEEAKLCFNETPSGYYLDENNNTYKACYKSCKFCYGQGKETKHNCKECITNYSFLNDSIYNSNCYEKCDHYYYFDESNEFNCVETCPKQYNKLIIEKKQCIDDCKKDEKYQFEYNKTCYKKCPDGAYPSEDYYICYDENPEGYYLDKINKTYKKCFETCSYCGIGGDKNNHNCLKCKDNYISNYNTMHITNCYQCNNYYYFNESNEFNCVEKCDGKYNKLIVDERKCINDCKNDDIYKYEYNNSCYKKCPDGTSINETNYICFENKNTEIIPIKDERDEKIEKFREIVSDFNISENKEDIIESKDNVTYQMTTTDNQKNNTNKNISSIDLGECEKILKEKYKIDDNLPLIIYKVDYFSPDSLIPIIGYEIYHPLNKSKLDLKYCEDILIKLNIPVNIDESKLFKYDPNSEFYNDNCFSYTTENGTDIILNDRKQEFSDNNLSLCENNCNYNGYNKDSKQSSCDCEVKNKIDSITSIKENPNKLSNNFDSDKSSSSSSSSNIVSIKCTKALFSAEGLKNNISSYILLIFICHFLLSIILFIKCGYHLLNDIIKKILYEKEKNQNNNKSENQIINQTNGNKIKGKNKLKNINFPPKKYGTNFINNNIPIEKGNNEGKSESKVYKLNNKIRKVNKKNAKKNKKSEKNKHFFSAKTKIKNIINLSFNDFELNSLDYKDAISYDKRTCCEYYLSLLKRKNPLIFSFCPVNDYNSWIIKLCIFSLSFSIYYATNFFFFDDNIMHDIYEKGGKYDVLFFLPNITFCFIASYYATVIIKFIFLSERNIYNIRKQATYSNASYISEKERKNLVIKYSIFFIAGIVFLFFFWMLLSSFGAVYQNTQMFIFKNALISFAISLFYPFFINIFPCLFRMCSLNSGNGDKECLYNFSKFLQWL